MKMKFNITRVLAVYSLCISTLQPLSNTVQAQTEMPKVIPLAPNAAALAKYGEIPVSYHTGTANVSIPLYTLQSGDIQFPIELSYHTGGIRVNELAGWTGLGWTLNAGGVVTRTLMDKDDLNSTALTPEVVTKGQLQKSLYDLSAQTNPPHDKGFTSTRGEYFDFTSALNGSIDFYDTEYDIFNYNVNGLSGRFILTRNTRQAIQEKKSDLVIVSPPGGTNLEFKIIDTNGVIYIFNNIEIASLPPTANLYNTAWYLTRIESPKGNIVTFSYAQTVLPSLASTNYFSPYGGCFGSGSTVTAISASYQQALILDRIDFNGGYVDFIHDENRTDYTAKRITGLKVFRNGNALPVKEFTFEYSYFNSDRMRLDKVTEKSGTQVLPPYQFSYNTFYTIPPINSKDIDFYGYYNAANNSTLVPVYRGPIKVSNGSPGITLQHDFIELSGANRDVNPSAMKLFSLSEVTYPTGGKTKFETEANTYEYNVSESLREIVPHYVKKDTLLQFTSRNLVSGSFSWIEDRNASDLKVTIGFICAHPTNGCQLYRNNPTYPYGSIYFELNGNRRDIAGDLVSCGGPQCQAELIANPYAPELNYSVKIAPNVGSDFNMISVRLEWFESAFNFSSNKNKNLSIGGLRVKRVSDYDANGKQVKSRTFEYHYKYDSNADGIAEDHSYGKRMAPPLYFRIYLESDQDVVCHAFQRYSTSTNPLGTPVSYDQVTEFLVDSNGVDIGKTIYYFENKQDSLYKYTLDQPGGMLASGSTANTRTPGLSNLSNKLNGSLLKRETFKRIGTSYQLVARTRNTYSTELINNYFSFQKEMHQAPGPSVCLAFIHPAIRHERVFHNQSIEEIYDTIDTTKVRIVQTINHYGNNHEQIIKISQSDPQGRTIDKVMIYPSDYGILSTTAYGVKQLKDRNIITPIEQYTTVNGNVTEGVFVAYKESSSLMDKVYQLETLTPIAASGFNHSNKVANTITPDNRYVERIAYKQYDAAGNPLELSKTKDIIFTYLWGYDVKVPIAEAINASFSEVAFSSFESSPNEGNWSYSGVSSNSIPAKTGKFCYPLQPSTSIGKALVPGKYYLEYYARAPITISAAVTPVVTDISTSAPDADNWIFYKKEVTITGSTTLILSTAGATVYIDEVRIYPVKAQMTTYTYDPLVGVTHMTDVNAVITSYEYDSFNRLKIVRDDKRNILKSMDYKYQTGN
jgi:hypothetical protein